LSVLSTIATTMYCLRSTRRRRRLALDLDLHRSLLEETTNEVVALKRAWEIDWGDVDLAARIDQGAEGAFGEVQLLQCGPGPGWLAACGKTICCTTAVRLLRTRNIPAQLIC